MNRTETKTLTDLVSGSAAEYGSKTFIKEFSKGAVTEKTFEGINCRVCS